MLHVVVDLSEGGSPPVIPVPALPHEAVHAGWAAGGTLHAVARLQQLKQGCVRELPPIRSSDLMTSAKKVFNYGGAGFGALILMISVGSSPGVKVESQ